MTHKPVLTKEVLEALNPKPNENFIDCTCGQGGHTKAISEKNAPKGKILGIDIDLNQIENCKLLVRHSFGEGGQIENFKNRVILVNDSYVNLKEIVRKNNFSPVSGILLDLGMSSWQLEESGKGFSFMKDEPLNMSYSDENFLTAEKIINSYSEKEIEKILKEYGEERFSKKIAKRIIEARKTKPIKSTFQLVKIIKESIPFYYQRQRIHFATRTFQALRIAVNDELNNLKKVLPQAMEVLEKEGRLAVISFHSLEDRIVKNFIKENKNKLEQINKKPITASKEEIINNPRSRSAKLRSAKKI